MTPWKNVEYQVRIRQNATGIVHVMHHLGCIRDGDENPSSYIWEDGNYACDCNRSLFFERAGEVQKEWDIPPCGDGAYSVELVNPVDGKVFYSEFGNGE